MFVLSTDGIVEASYSHKPTFVAKKVRAEAEEPERYDVLWMVQSLKRFTISTVKNNKTFKADVSVFDMWGRVSPNGHFITISICPDDLRPCRHFLEVASFDEVQEFSIDSNLNTIYTSGLWLNKDQTKTSRKYAVQYKWTQDGNLEDTVSVNEL